MDPVTALGAVSTVLTIVDKIANQIDRFIHKKPEPATEKPHSVLAKKEGDAIIVRRGGQVVQKITAADIAKLDINSQKLIKAMEESMQKNFDLWTAVYPQRDASPDPLRNAQVDAQLKDIAKKMCSDLNRIFKYLKSIGSELEDHYSHVRFVCAELGHS
jgi:hypothetical protein